MSDPSSSVRTLGRSECLRVTSESFPSRRPLFRTPGRRCRGRRRRNGRKMGVSRPARGGLGRFGGGVRLEEAGRGRDRQAGGAEGEGSSKAFCTALQEKIRRRRPIILGYRKEERETEMTVTVRGGKWVVVTLSLQSLVGISMLNEKLFWTFLMGRQYEIFD